MASTRARLMAVATSRWCRAQLPLIRRGIVDGNNGVAAAALDALSAIADRPRSIYHRLLERCELHRRGIEPPHLGDHPLPLREVAEQFQLEVPGEADVMLRIMESDPRMPRFIASRTSVDGW